MNQRIVVRNYGSDDLSSVKNILSDYPGPTGRVWTEDAVEEMMSDALKEQPDGVFVAEIDGRVVGFSIVFYRDWFNIAYLDYIQVKLDWISKGVGRALIGKCLSWARRHGARLIYTETGQDNETDINFYQRHGFKITGGIPEYYRQELDAVLLVKKLSNQA